jgi:serine/threonine-protein kinase
MTQLGVVDATLYAEETFVESSSEPFPHVDTHRPAPLTSDPPPDASRVDVVDSDPQPASGEARDASPRHTLLFPLGRGGMGSVYLAAREARGVRRLVALKRMLPGDALDGARVDLFMREARLAVLLEHPNVVRAIDFGEESGEPYLAMEYIEGKSLARLLSTLREAGRAMPKEMAAHLCAELAEALHVVHTLKDIDGAPLRAVHRDVSPHNLMVSYEGRVVLLDFGITKIDDGPKLTMTGHVRGKIAYMSPEQAASDRLDHRSDLFGVGVLLYECAVGRELWQGAREVEILRRLAEHDLPAANELEGLGLAAVFKKLTAAAPADRFADAKAAADALRACAPEMSRDRVRAWMRELFAEDIKTERLNVQRALREAADGAASRSKLELRSPPTVPTAPAASASASVAATEPSTPGGRPWGVGRALLGGVGVAVALAALAWRQSHRVDESTGAPIMVGTGSARVAPTDSVQDARIASGPSSIPSAIVSAVAIATATATASPSASPPPPASRTGVLLAHPTPSTHGLAVTSVATATAPPSTRVSSASPASSLSPAASVAPRGTVDVDPRPF